MFKLVLTSVWASGLRQDDPSRLEEGLDIQFKGKGGDKVYVEVCHRSNIIGLSFSKFSGTKERDVCIGKAGCGI